MVKILCASDTHGIADVGKLAMSAIRRKVDVLVIAGDIEPAYKTISTEGYFYGVFMEAVRKLMHHYIEVVVVPGNHDFFLNKMMTDDPKRRLVGNLHILVDRSDTVCGLKFYGTPWVPFINGRWCWERFDGELEDTFYKIPKGVDVLISHTPPLGYDGNSCYDQLWDVSMENERSNWRHLGSRRLRYAIEDKCPKVVVCGHIHTGDHDLGMIGKTTILNCSLIDERYHEAYKPSEIIIDDGEMKFRTNGGVKWRKLTNWRKDT